jgi:hypothetical protein
MEASWYMIAIFAVLLIGIASSIILYIYSRELYLKYRLAIRKTYYGIVVISAFLLWAFGVFPDVGTDLQNWAAVVISVVIIDLFVFQTPDITKFMSHEFKHESLVESINRNRGTFIELSDKLIKVNQMIPKNLSDWVLEDFEFTPEHYEETVLLYLKRFASDFQIDVYSYLVKEDPDEEQFKRNVEKVYKQIKDDHGLTIRAVGMREAHAIEKILRGENIEIIDGESSAVLFPYFGEYYNLIFLLTSRQNKVVTGADASLMLNLLYTFDLWLQANEDELLYRDDDDENESEDSR